MQISHTTTRTFEWLLNEIDKIDRIDRIFISKRKKDLMWFNNGGAPIKNVCSCSILTHTNLMVKKKLPKGDQISAR